MDNYTARKTLKRQLLSFVKYATNDLLEGNKWWKSIIKTRGDMDNWLMKEDVEQQRLLSKVVGMADVIWAMNQIEEAPLSETTTYTLMATCGGFVITAHELAIRYETTALRYNDYFARERCRELSEFISTWTEKLASFAKATAEDEF